MTTKTYQMETVTCPSCIKKIEGMLGRTAGVAKSEVMFNSSRVSVTFDEKVTTSDEIKAKIATLGYKVLSER